MSVVRRFLVAPSLVRLIRKERGGSRITEGYFAPQAGRTSYVRVDGQQCQLILVTGEGAGEERTDVPRAHGDALLDVCSGKAAYDRTALSVNGRDALVDRYVSPASLDLLTVTFGSQDEANGFTPPLWFSREVTADAAYERHAIALQGVPQNGEISLTNAALDAVLDLIEPRFGFGRYGGSPTKAPEPRAPERRQPEPAQSAPQGQAAEDDGVVNALRRAAGNAAPSAAATAPVAAGMAQAAEPIPSEPEPAASPEGGDARIDDVIESLSQALGAAIHQPPEGQREEDPVAAFERWTVRPRRTQQQP